MLIWSATMVLFLRVTKDNKNPMEFCSQMRSFVKELQRTWEQIPLSNMTVMDFCKWVNKTLLPKLYMDSHGVSLIFRKLSWHSFDQFHWTSCPDADAGGCSTSCITVVWQSCGSLANCGCAFDHFTHLSCLKYQWAPRFKSSSWCVMKPIYQLNLRVTWSSVPRKIN